MESDDSSSQCVGEEKIGHEWIIILGDGCIRLIFLLFIDFNTFEILILVIL